MGCPKLAEGEAVRITRVDGCGRPQSGADNAFASECWAEVAMKPNIDNGTDIKLVSMKGKNCGFKKACPDLLGFDVTAKFFEASPEMIEILTGNPVYFDHDGVTPIGWDDCAVACTSGFGLEIWQNVLVEGCAEDADGAWFYWLLPWLTNGVISDVTVNSSGLTFTLTASTRANNAWELGPWNVQAQDNRNTPGPLLTPIGADCHRRGFLTTIEPPTITCEYVTVPPVAS